MNTERILQLADVIEKTPHKNMPHRRNGKKQLRGFNMSDWHCGTVGCIGGWAGEVFGGRHWEARELLGLGFRQADHLFYGHGVPNDCMADITPTQAAAVLRHLAATGEVDWSVTP